MNIYKDAFDEFTDKSIQEKICIVIFLLVLFAALAGTTVSHGPLVQIVDSLNYMQAKLLQNLVSDEMRYSKKTTLILMSIVGAIPYLIVKLLPNKQYKHRKSE